MLRVKRHSVVTLAPPNGISLYHLVRQRIDDRKDVLILQIDIDLAGNGIILRHPGFTVETQGTYNLVLVYVDDDFGSPSFVGNVQLVEGSGVGAAVRLRCSLELLTTFICLRSTTPIVSSCAFEV